MKKFFLTFALCTIAAFAASAQAIAPSAKVPVADGVVGAAEYAVTADYSGMKLSYSLSADGKTLYFAISAQATGWVSIGLGNTKMDGAYMVIAADNAGKTAMDEKIGTRFGHKASGVKKVAGWAVKEAGGATTLEFSTPSSEWLAQPTLKLILAWGKSDNLNSMHSKYASAELPIQK